MRLLRPIVAFALLAAPQLASAQQHTMHHPVQLTAEDYQRAERWLGQNVLPLVSGAAAGFTWLPDGRVWYRVQTPSGAELRIVDPARNQSRVCVQGQDPCQATPPARPAHAAPPRSSVSPDGSKAVFIRSHNLWVKDLVTGVETALTTDGIEDFGYATNNAGWTHSDNPVVTWSPDSKRLATFQHDGRGVSMMYLTTTNVGAPQLQAWRYPLPGDSVIFRIHRVVIALDGGNGRPSVTRLQMPADQHRSRVSDHIACGGSLCDLQWYPDGSQIAFVSSSRDHKQMWMRVANATTGEVRTLYDESSPTHIGDASTDDALWRVLPGSNELIQWSQRDGWMHLYLFDLRTGQLKNRITTGDGNVTRIVHVDERARRIYFTAQGREAGRDPYFNSLYRVNFDGRQLVHLTPEVGNHSVQMSPDARWIIDTYSQANVPPVTVLRDGNTGRVVRELARTDISRLTAAGWKAPQPFTVKARDGQTDLYGLMFTPTNIDSTKKYPIINYIYPGPQGGSVGSRSFSPARGDHQALADLGFVVVLIDGMGSSPQRSKAFHDAYYGRMNDNGIPDQVAGMQELARRHRFIDIEKVGIWGHSGGGFATAAAMFRAPEFFKVGIAESGNHDNRNYEDDWGERYQGLLVRQGNSDNYAAEANQTHAANLRGKLFLIHGMMDDNVPPSNTLLVADALMKANKDFDMIMLPNARHGFGVDGQYIMRRRWDYFVTHLQGNIPPKEYRIGQRR
ncbi:MAG TPA: DPP IV N-terminal domain-containing protein [Gemmatimonadaceae bacterium]|nr:DPP IV N-terminal domain-containing protein [Gemmatimonadaceae bacterium]HRQ78154.1 DPP IV N-terminal domain-containing protein [Gemmatimonadaceae bacterium]